MGAPLDGLLVLDLSRVLAGPFCTMMLGDLGARVVKVEHPGDGDVTRGWGPPYDPRSGLSAYFLSVNRNKESIALDLGSPEGAESVRRLARRADVLVENFPPGGLEKFGLSAGELRRENPRLVTASITGFGPRGPDATAPGFDLLAQAGAGLMAITGTPESGPTKVGVAVSDLLAGCYAAIGILAALTARERTGRGTHVETDLFSATLGSLINVAQSALRHGRGGRPPRKRAPADRPVPDVRRVGRRLRPRRRHGPAVRAARRPRRPAGVGRRRALPRQRRPRAPSRGARTASFPAIFRREARASWVARCREAGIPAGPVRGPLEALRSETARALGAVVEAGGFSFVASPIRVEGASRRLEAPPALDADGERLRREFDLPG